MSITGYRRILAIGAFAGSLVSAPSVANEGREIFEYGCADIVVTGTLETIYYTDQSAEDDLLGQGRYEYRVTLRRILRGAEQRRVVRAIGVSHASFVNGQVFLLVLSPADEATYLIGRARLWHPRDRPKIAQTCRNDR